MQTDLARVERERDFHDHRFSDDSSREATGKFYAAVPSAKDDYRSTVMRKSSGRVLEYGCGTGSLAFDISARAEVVGIDISPVAIETAQDRARQENIDARFVEMNAESLDFEPHSFDLVCGSGIIHHLDVESAARELHRVVRPGGSAVFLEPMGYNPLINWYRDRTPGMRTDDEHPLVRADFDSFARCSESIELRYHGLAALAAAPFLEWRGGAQVSAAMQQLDRVLLRTPLVRELAWIVVIDIRF